MKKKDQASRVSLLTLQAPIPQNAQTICRQNENKSFVNKVINVVRKLSTFSIFWFSGLDVIESNLSTKLIIKISEKLIRNNILVCSFEEKPIFIFL